jgi:hypothetical protein
MSRGHGDTQRKILAWLGSQPRQRWQPLTGLAHEVYGSEPSRGQVETVRRSVKRLAAEGLAEMALCSGSYLRKSNYGYTYVVHGSVLCARLPPTEAEQAAEHAEREESQRRYEEIVAEWRRGR